MFWFFNGRSSNWGALSAWPGAHLPACAAATSCSSTARPWVPAGEVSRLVPKLFATEGDWWRPAAVPCMTTFWLGQAAEACGDTP
mmetsp:Transcript_21578/g.41950  ORF Transcript_21578/g.41950 Transcript_21578/m.41950 type:complete len:85 (-) Transcript_21578:203-457(-)